MISRADAIAHVRPILEAEGGVIWAYLFGSCARGELGKDIDVAIMPREGAWPTAVAWGGLIARLEAAAGYKVDLVDLRTAPLPLLGTLLVDRVTLVDREPDARHEWEADTATRWIDFRPAYERQARVRRQAMEARLRGRR